MSLKISELPLSGTVSGTELVPIVQDGETRQITLSEISPVVPSTAKFYLPDLSTITTALIDISDIYGPTGTATYSENILWSTFTTSNVNALLPPNAPALLNCTEFTGALGGVPATLPYAICW